METHSFGSVEAKKYTIEEMQDKITSYLLDTFRETVTPECSLCIDLGFDSLDMIETVMWCEAEFEIEISNETMQQIETVEDLFRIVESKSNRLVR